MALRLLVRRVCGVSVRDLQRVPASRRSASFNVQDHDDFTDRVINSQLPVLVDFHAQYGMLFYSICLFIIQLTLACSVLALFYLFVV